MEFTPELEREILDSLTANSYEPECRLGSGSFGVVYKVKSLRWENQEFVVKAMLSQHSLDNSEFEVLLGLSHPHILRLYQQWFTDHCHCMTLEYAPGGSLADVLKTSGPLQRPMFRAIAEQSLIALDYCHSCNFFHGDIKPANILLDAHGRVKLADFGCAGKRTEHGALPIQGSLAYMSPELVRGRSKNGPANDIWALGITFYELVTGRLPWQSKDKTALSAEIMAGFIGFPQTMDSKLRFALQRMLDGSAGRRATADQLLLMPVFMAEPDARKELAAPFLAAAVNTLGLRAAHTHVGRSSKSLTLMRVSSSSPVRYTVAKADESNPPPGDDCA
jgi:serine/threonine protein kinase